MSYYTSHSVMLRRMEVKNNCTLINNLDLFASRRIPKWDFCSLEDPEVIQYYEAVQYFGISGLASVRCQNSPQIHVVSKHQNYCVYFLNSRDAKFTAKTCDDLRGKSLYKRTGQTEVFSEVWKIFFCYYQNLTSLAFTNCHHFYFTFGCEAPVAHFWGFSRFARSIGDLW